jgi:cytochrome c
MSNFNAIAGAVLASVLGVMTVGTLADNLLKPHYAAKPGYLPEVIETSASGGPAQEAPPDFGRLFADPARLQEFVTRGERGVAVCKSCHTFEAGGGNLIGPNLHDAFGRSVASHAGFAYSAAMQAHGGVWTYDTLNDYLRAPAQVVRGTNMAFAGIRNTEDRVAVIAYLRSISPSPPPLPAPLPEAPAAEGTPAPEAAKGAPTAPAPAEAPASQESPAATPQH